MSSSSDLEGMSHLANDHIVAAPVIYDQVDDNPQSSLLGFSSNHENTVTAVQEITAIAKKISKNKNKLPIGIRMIIYSYLDLNTLLSMVCCLSKKDREMLVSNNELLN